VSNIVGAAESCIIVIIITTIVITSACYICVSNNTQKTENQIAPNVNQKFIQLKAYNICRFFSS